MGESGCEGDVKIEDDYAHIEAPYGKEIAYVCVKAGRNVFTFYPGDNGDGCYYLDWDCHCEVTVYGGGISRDCKEVSHVAVTFKNGECD